MRYSTGHKQRTRERIVRAASRRFRSRGSEGSGITDLMRDLRLTHGGFYRHFDRKEDLFVEAFKQALNDFVIRAQKAISSAPPGEEARALIDTYLALEHCDNAADGCPLAALATEVARRSKAAREPLLRALRDHVSRLQEYVPGATDAEKRRHTIALLSGMAGTLTLARAFPNVEDRQRILDGARQFYRNAIGAR